MESVRIDQYICLDVDQIIVDEMKDILTCKMRRTDQQEDRDNLAKLKRAARVVLGNYTVVGTRWQL